MEYSLGLSGVPRGILGGGGGGGGEGVTPTQVCYPPMSIHL